MFLTWLGHAGIKITSGKTTIYIDPVFPDHKDQPADIILITSSQPDHWNRATVEHLLLDHTRILGPAEVARQMHGIETLRENEAVETEGIKIAAVPARPNRRAPGASQTGIGVVLNTENKNVYHTGDTAPFPEMAEIHADILLVPVGGGAVTMNAREAVETTGLVKPRIAIPIHYGGRAGHIDDAELYKEKVESQQDTAVMILLEGKTIEL